MVCDCWWQLTKSWHEIWVIVNKYGLCWDKQFWWHLKFKSKRWKFKILKPIRRQWDWTIGLSAKFYHLPFWFEPLFGKTIDWKSITCHHPLFKCKNCHQLSCGIWTCPNYTIVDDCRWWSMTVHNYLCSNMCDSWNHLCCKFFWGFM